MQMLTAGQVAGILGIDEITVNLLADDDRIPHTFIKSEGGALDIRFQPDSLSAWLRCGPVIIMDEQAYLDELKREFQEKYPEAIRALQEFDRHFSPRREGKGFSLCKVPNKKYGFLYYVRYVENGKLVASRWNTHTNLIEAAEAFARANRDRILAGWHERKDASNNLYGILGEYYAPDSPWLAAMKNRGRTICEKSRRMFYLFLNKNFIPFLRENRVAAFGDITAPLIARYQDRLLQSRKPVTVNRDIGCVRLIFDHLVLKGIIERNVFNDVKAITESSASETPRGCYDITLLSGAFNRPWEDERSYLLCLLIYATGMRNGEIERLRPRDIEETGGIRFIRINQSKTENGLRLVPLHEFVYKKLMAYIARNKTGEEEAVFGVLSAGTLGRLYSKANSDLGKRLGLTAGDLKAQGITYYSGRHYWKTLMNAGELGDVEEYFMGHKVAADVAKRYNHKDKQGMDKIIEKAKRVFAILDERLFTAKPGPRRGRR